MLPFFRNILLLFFYCWLLTIFFIHGSVNDNFNVRKVDAEFRYSLFSENQSVFMALRKSFSKNLTEVLSFAFNCYSFGSLIFNLTIQRSKFITQEVQVILLYSLGCDLMSLMILNVFVLRKFFWTCQFFIFILVNILFILSKYRSTSSPYRIQTNFVADCLMRRFSCFSYYRFSYKILWFLCINYHFFFCFCFFCKR